MFAYIFYHRIRPYLAGWPAPGLLYEGTGLPPQIWAGGSAAQSSLLQSIDAALGICHEHAHTRDFLDAMLQYMPPKHRAFVAELREASSIRTRALEGAPALRDAYNACIAVTDEFRRKHIGLTSQYIVKQASTPFGPGTTGTGGTDFVEIPARVAGRNRPLPIEIVRACATNPDGFRNKHTERSLCILTPRAQVS